MATLEDLPVEILFHILSFCSPFSATLVASHPLYVLAATTKHLNTVVEEYARGLLKLHATITALRGYKIATQRRTWIRWLGETCQLCKKGSKRRAILDPSLTCCSACDRKYFPKRTMTDAQKTYNLSKLDIFTPSAVHPTLPPLTVGTYVVMGGNTTMIAEKDLVARRDYIHSMLGDKAKDAAYMRHRRNLHNRTIKKLNIRLSTRSLKWVEQASIQKEGTRRE